MTKKIAFIIAFLTFAADQAAKYLTQHFILPSNPVEIIPGYFELVHIMNRGVAFGAFADGDGIWRPILFYGAAIFASAILYGMYKKLPQDDKIISVSIGLLWGGIAGNILDRIRFGAVVDFLSVHIRDVSVAGIPLHWPAFNIADSAITVAVFILLIMSFKGRL